MPCLFRLVFLCMWTLFMGPFSSRSQVITLGREELLQQPIPLYLNYGSFYIDSTCSEGIASVSRRSFQPFSYYFTAVPRHLPPKLSVWLKVQIQSQYSTDTSVVFYPGFQNYVEVYYADNGRLARVAVCGNLFAASLLSIGNMRQAAFLPLTAGYPSTFYIRITNHTTYHVDPFKPYLMSKSSLNELQVKLLENSQRTGYIFFIGIGMFVIMFFYISIKWVYTEDSAYYYYALTILFSAIFFLLNFFQDGNNQLIMSEKPLVIYLLPDACAWISLYAYWQFVRRFLYIDTNMPVMARWMKYTSYLILAFAVFNLWYAFRYADLMRLIAMDTTAGIILLIAGSYTLFRIRKVNAGLKRFLYGGIFCMLLFYALGSLYELLRDTQWGIFPELGGGTPLVMLGNISEMLFFSLGLAYRNKLEGEERARFQRLAAEAEIKALRSQMNPHFIFNCMNTIDAYIFKEQPEKASRFLHTFSQLIRSVLENSQHNMVSLQKELEGLRLFIDLERERYNNSFDVEYHFPANVLEHKVPPLIIQPYVENAIVHGLRHKTRSKGILRISVEVAGEELQIIVKDNGIGREAARRIKAINGRPHQSLALTLTQQRLDLMPEKGSVSILDIGENGETGTEVHISIPIVD